MKCEVIKRNMHVFTVLVLLFGLLLYFGATPAAFAADNVWEIKYSGSGGFWGVDAVDANTAWAVGMGGIRKTTDGGATWQSQSQSAEYWEVDALNANIAWAVGSEGTIVKTTNGGATWVEQDSGTLAELYGISVAANDWSIAYAVGGNPYTHSGIILKTTDGGATWVEQYWPSCLWDVSAPNANTAFVAGDNRILKTGDGGATWSTQYSGTLAWYASIHAVNANLAYAAGGPVLKTTDGVNWAVVRPYDPATCLLGISAAPAGNTAWAVGPAGVIMKTGDQGATWVAQASGTQNNLMAVSAINASTAWAAGYPGVILRIKGPSGKPGCGTGGGMAAIMLGLTLGLLSVAGYRRMRKQLLAMLQ